MIGSSLDGFVLDPSRLTSRMKLKSPFHADSVASLNRRDAVLMTIVESQQPSPNYRGVHTLPQCDPPVLSYVRATLQDGAPDDWSVRLFGHAARIPLSMSELAILR